MGDYVSDGSEEIVPTETKDSEKISGDYIYKLIVLLGFNKHDPAREYTTWLVDNSVEIENYLKGR